MKTPPEFDYATLLASAIHEVKNSLNMLLNSIDQVVDNCHEDDCQSKQQLSQIQYESKRVSDDLVELLAIYRINSRQYVANIDEYPVYDFLFENLCQHETMIRHRGIDTDIECERDLYWVFDSELISGVMSNVINNLYKYTKDQLHISAFREDGYLVIQIRDNGPGYPEAMLIDSHAQQGISFGQGNTGLGLYFSRLVAELHKNKGNSGYIKTTNDGIDGGGCFSIYLP